MSETPARRQCPSCSGSRLRYGVLPDSGGSWVVGTNRMRFMPEGNWVTAYNLRAFACLECGFVGLCLHAEDLASLNQEG